MRVCEGVWDAFLVIKLKLYLKCDHCALIASEQVLPPSRFLKLAQIGSGIVIRHAYLSCDRARLNFRNPSSLRKREIQQDGAVAFHPYDHHIQTPTSAILHHSNTTRGPKLPMQLRIDGRRRMAVESGVCLSVQSPNLGFDSTCYSHSRMPEKHRLR